MPGREKTAAARGLRAAEGSPQVHGFAGDDAEVVLPFVHRLVRVVDERHRLRIRIHIGRRNVCVGPDVVVELDDEAPGDVFEILGAESLGVADDTALGTTEGNAHHSALPRHPRGERPNLVLRDVGVVSHAPLAGTADATVHGTDSRRNSAPRPTWWRSEIPR